MAKKKIIIIAIAVVAVVGIVTYVVASRRSPGTAKGEQTTQSQNLAERSGGSGIEGDRTDRRRNYPDGTQGAAQPGAPGQQPVPGAPGGQGQPGGRRGFRMGGAGLGFLLMGIGHLEEGGQAALTPAQAKSVLAVIDPLKSKATLDPQEAQQASEKVMAILTDQQKQAMFQGFGGRQGRPGEQPGQPGQPGQRAPGGPDGQRRPDGQRPQGGPEGQRPQGDRFNFDPNVNPLNPSSGSRMAGRVQEVIQKLKAKAK